MPAMFSCTELFRASYFLKIRRKIGMAVRIIQISAMAMTGITQKNNGAILGLMEKLIAKENTIISGVRTAIRIII